MTPLFMRFVIKQKNYTFAIRFINPYVLSEVLETWKFDEM